MSYVCMGCGVQTDTLRFVCPNCQRWAQENERLTRERDDLRALLREIEWGDDGTCCPCCRALKSPMDPEARWYLFSMQEGRVGHAPDCRLKAALEG